jgi:ATP synthase protein I
MSDDRSPHSSRNDADGDRKRLDDLDARLRAAREGSRPRRPSSRTTQRQMSFAYRVLVEMAVGVGVGGFVGWWLDRWLGTAPIFLVVMLFLGFAAGALNAYRASQAYTAGLRDDEQSGGEQGGGDER